MKLIRCFFCLGIVLFCLSSVEASPKNVIAKLLENAYAKGEFSGVVLAAKGDKIIYSGAVGQANREWKIANDANTKFRICSVTKQFTAMLLMQLVEAGKINLDGTIADYLPDFRQAAAGKIKIRHLLLSASGLPVLPDEFYVSEDKQMTDANFVINKYLQGDLLFEPGAKFNYNNGDFIILGAIIERVSGKSYETNLREKILQPLGMRNSGLVKNETVIENLANGYSFRDGKFFNESFVQIENFGAAGAMYSTAEDLFLWDKALLNYKLLSKKYTDEMFTPSSKLGFVGLGSWAYDLDYSDGKRRRMIERQGYINGFCVVNLISYEDKISAVIISNTETQTLFRTYGKVGLSYAILDAMFKK